LTYSRFESFYVTILECFSLFGVPVGFQAIIGESFS